ncbi:hypothetical protein ACS0TY_000508 [Phlomoides rotata]
MWNWGFARYCTVPTNNQVQQPQVKQSRLVYGVVSPIKFRGVKLTSISQSISYSFYDKALGSLGKAQNTEELPCTNVAVGNRESLTKALAEKFPIGIHSEWFIRALDLPQVKDHIKELKERFSGRKVMLGVDHLDMIKGIPQKILAFEKFLEENPIWRDKVVLVQIVVPTRTDVPEYQKLSS